MRKINPYLLIFFLMFCLPAAGQGVLHELDSSLYSSGFSVILSSRDSALFTPVFKEADEKPFEIEAVYETGDCENTLVSIEAHNAHPPLSWYELNATGQRVQVLYNPQLNHFKNHTTYVVEDMSQHTDTVYIDFRQSLEIIDIYPNPHRGAIHIDYSAIDPTQITVGIFDFSGRKIFEENYQLLENQNQLTLNLDPLAQGVYFLSLNGLCIHELLKIIHLEQ
jgi:hypothetical protein